MSIKNKNITTIFMMPTLKIPKDDLLSNGFVSAYINDDRADVQYEGAIYILFKPNDFTRFREFLEREHERTDKIIEDYDYEDGYVVVVYKLDDNFKEDFSLIKQGKYSKTSKEFQNLFPKAVKIMQNGKHRDEISLQIRIFKKTEDLIEYWEDKLGTILPKDLEVWEGFHEQNETLSLDKIIQYV